MASGSPFTEILKATSTVLVADLVSVRVDHFNDVRFLDDVRCLGHSATLSTETADGVSSD
jgi:hypothetical protein